MHDIVIVVSRNCELKKVQIKLITWINFNFQMCKVLFIIRINDWFFLKVAGIPFLFAIRHLTLFMLFLLKFKTQQAFPKEHFQFDT